MCTKRSAPDQGKHYQGKYYPNKERRGDFPASKTPCCLTRPQGAGSPLHCIYTRKQLKRLANQKYMQKILSRMKV